MKNYNFTATQDWHHYFKTIFNQIQINNMLEFGLGDGTEFLLDHCAHVTSLEISIGEFSKSWFDKCIDKYKLYANWEPLYVLATPEILHANEMAMNDRYPINYDAHLVKLKEIITPILKNKKYDFIFIDAGFHNRGDLVNLVWNQAPIIAAHDTSRDESRILKNIYGYNIVNVPNNYQEIHFENTYMGTTIWMDKKYGSIIDLVKNTKIHG